MNQQKQKDDLWKFIIKVSIGLSILMIIRVIVIALAGTEKKGSKLELLLCQSDQISAMCSTETCTKKGKYNLYWTVKMNMPTYVYPDFGNFFLLIFLAPLLMKQYVQVAIMAISGPLIGLIFSDVSSSEQGSIWSLLSVISLLLELLYFVFTNKKQHTQ